MERFEMIPEPSGTWAIFDALLGVFAEIRGEALIGFDERSAREVLHRLQLETSVYTALPQSPFQASARA